MVYIFVTLLIVLLVLMALMYRSNRIHHSAMQEAAATSEDRETDQLAHPYEELQLEWRPSEGERPAKPSIMIVDDQAMIRILLVEVFVSCGLEVYEAGDGEGAIRQFALQPVDLVLMDLKMPEMNGIEALVQLRRLKPDLIAVMISAYGEPEDVETAEQLGVTRFFDKPFDIDELKLHVLHQLEQSRG
ncbi:response regulator [Paenibacillus sp. 598K]|uniref:response regulator n=1 Tax=Paenibacillus sp. 598K TaxID=1117987 RepID=UPI000FFA1533|nr:response regulator [Paenibacillus sp. 598K]GBF75886.1 response regulator [Paenibacillus sp. 598K]